MRALLIWQCKNAACSTGRALKDCRMWRWSESLRGQTKPVFQCRSKWAQVHSRDGRGGVYQRRALLVCWSCKKYGESRLWTWLISDKSSVRQPLMLPLSENYHKRTTLHWRNVSFTVNKTMANVRYLSDSALRTTRIQFSLSKTS